MTRLLILVAALICVSCQTEKFESEAELNAYVKDIDNGLIQVAEIEDFSIQVMYKPTDILVNQELGNSLARRSRIDSLRNKYSPYYYFILSLSRNEHEALHNAGGGMGQYSELVQTLSFHMNEYVTVTTNALDTIPVGDFSLNRTYGVSASTDLLFVFNKERAIDKEWVQFNLNEFGLGVGNQRFRFKREKLDHAPTINFAITP